MKVAQRYFNLVREIDRVKPVRILEIGSCKGQRAELMIDAAQKHQKKIEYFGFDLFEPPPGEEFSARTHPWPIDLVRDKLDRPGVVVHLVKGDTKKTLPTMAGKLAPMDFVFLDGGHSEETVASDFANILQLIAPGAPIMLDDYWNFPGGGGCKPLVDRLDRSKFNVEILEPVDSFAKPYGVLNTQIVKVTSI